PQYLVALLLRKLVDAAESHLGGRLAQAVLTVPGTWGEVPRTALLQAARIAGLEPAWRPGGPDVRPQRARLLAGSTAAALAAGFTGRGATTGGWRSWTWGRGRSTSPWSMSAMASFASSAPQAPPAWAGMTWITGS